jgi:acyl-homoserine-lactone acylase
VSFLRVRLGSICFAAAIATAGTSSQGQEGSRSEILWDRWGVPHIFARTDEDLGFAYGWAQMHSHGDKILRLYALARGRAAEYWGTRYLASDRFVRTMAIPEIGARDVERQPPAFRRYLTAFADGMNAYARTHPERIGDSVRAVLPVTAADLLRHAHHVSFMFVAGTGNRAPIIGLDGEPAASAPTATMPASNAWAIGPRRSASGHALLLANPHLPWGSDAALFYEAQLVGPGVRVYGATLIGFPVVAIGFNDSLGWSHTVNTIDALDTYKLVLVDGGYRFDGRVRPFETERQTLRVREPGGNMRDESLVIRRTVHGPVIKLEDSTIVAVRTSSLDAGGALREWWDMGRARNLSEFETSLRRLQIPMFNVVYADGAGHIFYLFNGRVPVRPFGDFQAWQTAVRGDTSATLWSTVLPYDRLPRVVDPPGGFVQNSNSPPWFAALPAPPALDPTRYPAYLAPRGLNFREQRGLHMLTSDSGITLDHLLEMRYSNRMELADRVLDELIAAARAAGRADAVAAADVLARWDRSADAESRGAVLFDAWARLAFASGAAFSGRGFARAWSASEPISTPAGLADRDSAVSALERAAKQVQSDNGALGVAWGAVNRLSAELPGNGAAGDPLGVFHVIYYDSKPTHGVHTPVAGDTYVAAVEFTPSGPRARVVLSYGNASQPGSPHIRDQLGLIARKEMRTAWITRADIEGHLESRTPITR